MTPLADLMPEAGLDRLTAALQSLKLLHPDRPGRELIIPADLAEEVANAVGPLLWHLQAHLDALGVLALPGERLAEVIRSDALCQHLLGQVHAILADAQQANSEG